MGMGIGARLFNGIKSAVNTVAVAEAHMAKTEKVKPPEKFPELGVLQFGTRFRGMDGAINPFTSGVRPATGPSVARPGMEQFKGTGGAFASEQTLQMSSGMRGLSNPMEQLRGLVDTISKNPQMQGAQSQLQSMGAIGPGGINLPPNMDAMSADLMRSMQTQKMMEQIERLFSTVSKLMQAAHEIAMNSIRNLKG